MVCRHKFTGPITIFGRSDCRREINRYTSPIDRKACAFAWRSRPSVYWRSATLGSGRGKATSSWIGISPRIARRRGNDTMRRPARSAVRITWPNTTSSCASSGCSAKRPSMPAPARCQKGGKKLRENTCRKPGNWLPVFLLRRLSGPAAVTPESLAHEA